MLEPRRLAARAAAKRIADEQGWNLGSKVGYQVRFENRTSKDTRLTVMTEGLLSRRLTRDPNLNGIGCVILDEFHERSWHSDIGLGLLRELQMLARPDLKIFVMSATLHAEKVSEYLGGCPIAQVHAEAHPIEIIYDKLPQLLTTGIDFTKKVSESILSVVQGKSPGNGDILVFLPGTREINNVAREIAPMTKDHEVHTLHGSLRLGDQDRAIQKSMTRKIILATNIAETSLTIDGVATVIDSGLARVMRQDANGFPRLELSRISQFSAVQRAGRSGRQSAGYCYRLWNKMDQASMPQSELPEIQRIDIAEAVLLLSAHGIRDWTNFSWFDRPSQQALAIAQNLLMKLGVEIEDNLPKITPLGQRLLNWPLHPRLARLMEAASPANVKQAARIAAILSEKDILTDASSLRTATSLESDILLRLETLGGHLGHRADSVMDRGAVATVQRSAEQLEKIAQGKLSPKKVDFTELELVALAFPDRICKRRRASSPEARMVGGKGVKLADSSSVLKSELFIAADAVTLGGGGARNDAMVTVASRIDITSLKNLFPLQVREMRKTELDETSGKVLSKIYLAYEDLPLEEPRQTEARSEDVAQLMPELTKEIWPQIFERNEKVKAWHDRYRFLRAACPGKAWPNFELTESVSPEVQSLIETICLGEKKPQDLFEKDFIWALEDLIGPELSAFLRAQAPATVQVPTGNNIRVQYPVDRQPFIEVRLQEVFGWKTAPPLAEGKVPMVVHLLGPNYRPVQVTQDLARFWQGSYAEVRKELRARYPKHSWPEDPMNAKPEAKGRPTKR